jgi:hypothetical protein
MRGDDVKRSLLIAIALLLACAALGTGSYLAAGRISAATLYCPTDDLDWLRLEFGLDDAALARIRTLHEGYLPKCEHYCAQIAAKKRELEVTLAATNDVSPAAERLMGEIAAVRTTCQLEMLRHFAEVSRAMPAEQGARYLAEMRRLTLGSHEQIERSMDPDAKCGHGCN